MDKIVKILGFRTQRNASPSWIICIKGYRVCRCIKSCRTLCNTTSIIIGNVFISFPWTFGNTTMGTLISIERRSSWAYSHAFSGPIVGKVIASASFRTFHSLRISIKSWDWWAAGHTWFSWWIFIKFCCYITRPWTFTSGGISKLPFLAGFNTSMRGSLSKSLLR